MASSRKTIRTQFTLLTLVGLALSSFYSVANASECSVSLVKDGSILTGTSFKASVDLANTPQDLAWQGAHNYVARDGWIIQRADKAAGLIAAQSARATRPTPLNIVVEKSGSGSKLTIAYTTPAGSVSPENAVRAVFCDLAAAASAASVTSADTTASTAPQAVAATTPPAARKEGPASAPAMTNDSAYVKAGRPCFLEICVGDGLEELKRVKWLPVQPNSLRVGSVKTMLWSPSGALTTYDGRLVASAKKTWQGDVSRIFRYLVQGSFDNEALQFLEGITASCTADVLYGVYVTPAGNPTTVSIAMRYPSSDSAAQRWTVIAANRSITSSGSVADSQHIQAQIRERYQGLMLVHESGTGTVAAAPHGTGQVNWVGGLLVLSVVDRINGEEKLRAHPFCGGGKKPSLD